MKKTGLLIFKNQVFKNVVWVFKNRVFSLSIPGLIGANCFSRNTGKEFFYAPCSRYLSSVGYGLEITNKKSISSPGKCCFKIPRGDFK